MQIKLLVNDNQKSMGVNFLLAHWSAILFCCLGGDKSSWATKQHPPTCAWSPPPSVFVFVFVFVFTVLLVKSAILPTCAWSPPPSASSGSCPGSLVSSPTPGQQHWPMRISQKQKQFNIFNIEPENESSTLISPSRASRSPLSSSTSSLSCVLSCRLCSRLTWWGWESPHWLYGWRWWDLLVELYQCS